MDPNSAKDILDPDLDEADPSLIRIRNSDLNSAKKILDPYLDEADSKRYNKYIKEYRM
jgi:hypothetical protein